MYVELQNVIDANTVKNTDEATNTEETATVDRSSLGLV